VKAIEKLMPVHEAQLLTYMRFGSIPVGLLLNFNPATLKNGIPAFAIGAAISLTRCLIVN
jgi:GxxExxY protein